MKILICSYREWANRIVNKLRNESTVEVEHLLEPELFEKKVTENQFDIIFFIGWSTIIPDKIVKNEMCVCMHPSPLPKYRGGSPIQHQILAGETSSAVTLFKMTKDIDAGPILWQKAFSLEGDLDEIFERIIEGTFEGITSLLNSYPAISYSDQISSNATYFARRTPEMSEITLDEIMSMSSKQLLDKVRCLQPPYPTAYIKCGDGSRLYLRKVDASIGN